MTGYNDTTRRKVIAPMMGYNDTMRRKVIAPIPVMVRRVPKEDETS